uniref:DUF1716 domain-containing protein n=1 Tax=Echinostoma caproni TaxID=27848 RepID=A0A183BGU5_9TREM
LRRSLKPPPPPSLNDVASNEPDIKRPRTNAEIPSPASVLSSEIPQFSGDSLVRQPVAGPSQTEIDEEEDGLPTTVGASEVNESTIRRLALLLEKRALANQEARTKFPDQPKRFMQSEVDLQETLEEMQVSAAFLFRLGFVFPSSHFPINYSKFKQKLALFFLSSQCFVPILESNNT